MVNLWIGRPLLSLHIKSIITTTATITIIMTLNIMISFFGQQSHKSKVYFFMFGLIYL